MAAVPMDAELTLIERFVRQADHAPRSVAVVQDGVAVTYGELASLARETARLVRRHAAGGSVVAVALPRSIEGVTAMLGVWWAGCSYLSLDPLTPAARRESTLALAGAALVLAGEETEADVLTTGRPVVRVPGPGEVGPAGGGCTAPEPAARTAYLVFTSGSTGEPKGVAMGERAIRRLAEWHEEEGGQLGRRTALFAAVGFDVAVQEVLATLCTGGTLVVVGEATRRDPARLLAELRRQEVHRLFLPTAVLQLVAEQAGRTETAGLPALTDVICAGERLRITPAVREMFARVPGCRLHNHYGPAETHVVTAWTADGDPQLWPDDPPIGVPLPHVEVELAPGEGQLNPAGPAELVIRGDRVAEGYVGRPDLTRQRFTGEGGRRGYRTGDLVVRRDGVLVFLGRVDRQVKVNGFRVEPEEIEAHLAQHPQVAACVVDAVASDYGTDLVAYVVPRGGGAGPDHRALRGFLADRLPAYMIPLRFHPVPDVPLTPNGKLDRDAVRAMTEPATAPVPAALVEPALESAVRLAFSRVLGHDDIRADENFFDLGGTSLRADRLRGELGRSLGRDFPVTLLYDHPTVRSLAVALGSGGPRPDLPPPRAGRARADSRDDRRSARRRARGER